MTATETTTKAVGTRLVELCAQGQHRRAIEELYADDAKAVEAVAGGPQGRETIGKENLLAGSDWFFNAFEIHDASIDGPYPCDDEFICFMSIDLTAKEGPTAGQRMQMKEAARYQVRDGKIVKSIFYYDPGC